MTSRTFFVWICFASDHPVIQPFKRRETRISFSEKGHVIPSRSSAVFSIQCTVESIYESVYTSFFVDSWNRRLHVSSLFSLSVDSIEKELFYDRSLVSLLFLSSVKTMNTNVMSWDESSAMIHNKREKLLKKRTRECESSCLVVDLINSPFFLSFTWSDMTLSLSSSCVTHLQN
jgi:hypothetical protein